ncbi:heparinase II/III family protein [Bowmanella denitrificans]|uniref:heparinase II/III family protein n=1 Tax=Bowmanella denitrificans TaxID=366582 RepID=UPI0015586344|nr:heparinase II/III family protein [Bowmanella denitrificans]
MSTYLASMDTSAQRLCASQNFNNQLACLALTPNRQVADRVKSLAEASASVPCTAAGNRNQDWRLALALDQLRYVAPELDYQLLEAKLSASLEQCLSVLDDGNASLWHGRFSLGAEAFIVAASLYSEGELLERAFYHFKQSVMALSLTEGWPGGYNYWIQNRGLTFFLALQAYLTSGQDSGLKNELLNLARRNTLWHIYMTRPDGQIQATGDEGSRVDLKDESKKVIDLLAKLTKAPEAIAFAGYIQHRHGRASYHRTNHWLIPFVYDPKLDYQVNADQGLAVFDGWLPNQAIFGRNYLNQIVLRTGWRADDSYVLINGGQQFSHHQHADAGHFIYFAQGKPVAVDGAVYGSILADFRLYYGIRSNAKNLLNLSVADTNYQPTHIFKKRQEDGSQHMSMPHGSAIRSVEHWLQENAQNRTYIRSELLAYQPGPQSHISLDLTPAYLRNAQPGLVSRRFTFAKDGSLAVTDSVQQLDVTLFSHLNLPDLPQWRCIDATPQQSIRLTPQMQLTVSMQGLPACQSPFSLQFTQQLEQPLRQQPKLAKGKAWSDGPFQVLGGAVKTDHGKASITWTFQPVTD